MKAPRLQTVSHQIIFDVWTFRFSDFESLLVGGSCFCWLWVPGPMLTPAILVNKALAKTISGNTCETTNRHTKDALDPSEMSARPLF
jgi:hypothetical protein